MGKKEGGRDKGKEERKSGTVGGGKEGKGR
jgi:hypothetical protein